MPQHSGDTLFDVAMEAPGEWSASGRARFDQPDGSQFGGYLSGLMLTAVLNEPDRRGSPVAMTGSFMKRAAAAPLTITTARLAGGSALEFWQASIVQNGALCAQTTVTLAQRPDSGPGFRWSAMPPAPPPESITRDEYGPNAPAHLNTFDTRHVRGWPNFEKDGIQVCWTKDVDGIAVDFPRLALFADKFAPRAFYGLGRLVASSTVSFSTYFHASEKEVAAIGADFVLQEGRGRAGSHGVCDLTAALWRRDGLLLATTEQLCWFR